ncbi:hypothetical protein [Streptomyces sp. ODS28]|uniref:hypothetical protein n=1 Tax=Streptomyces sp. ODS28 TaxID=3136688 RepID=UPI0031E9E2DD
MKLTLNVALLLAVIVVVRVRRKPLARTRGDAWLTAFITLALGILIAPTSVGRGILDFLEKLVNGISQAGG